MARFYLNFLVELGLKVVLRLFLKSTYLSEYRADKGCLIPDIHFDIVLDITISLAKKPFEVIYFPLSFLAFLLFEGNNLLRRCFEYRGAVVLLILRV